MANYENNSGKYQRVAGSDTEFRRFAKWGARADVGK